MGRTGKTKQQSWKEDKSANGCWKDNGGRDHGDKWRYWRGSWGSLKAKATPLPVELPGTTRPDRAQRGQADTQRTAGSGIGSGQRTTLGGHECGAEGSHRTKKSGWKNEAAQRGKRETGEAVDSMGRRNPCFFLCSDEGIRDGHCPHQRRDDSHGRCCYAGKPWVATGRAHGGCRRQQLGAAVDGGAGDDGRWVWVLYGKH